MLLTIRNSCSGYAKDACLMLSVGWPIIAQNNIWPSVLPAPALPWRRMR